ncbi:U3 small nucleolar RNA-associated protein 20 [Termitomyces sp. J132]|nr:U3 small nucleolar RNA-associated protein 20 [Termitomyces sp. J132]
MPLLLHNWKDIYALWIEALVVADDEGLRALLDLIQKMAHDLRTTLSPIYTNILSASQTLHTATSSIFSSLMEAHLASGGPEKTYTLIRRTLTALIHHVKDSSAFAPLADLLFQCFTTTVVGLTPASPSTTSDVTIERVRRMLEIMSIPCAVRQGSRLAQNQLSLILSELLKIPLFTALHSALLKFCTAALTAAEMSLWLGPGMKFFQRAWACSLSSAQEQEDDETYAPAPVLHFVLSLTGALSSLSWGGWKSVALPLLLKNTARPEVRAHDAKGVLRLLASLKKAGKLGSSSESGSGEVNVVWRGRMEEWVLNADLKDQATEATELEDMFTLTPLFSPAVCLVIVNIIKGLLASSTSNGDKDASTLENMNTAWALGTSMATLATRDPSEWSSYVVKELPVWIRRCVTHWGWSPSVLEGLVSLSKKINQAPIPIPFNEVYPSLRVFLLSHSQSLRLATLRLLTSESVGASGDVREAAGLCLKGEEVSLDVQGVRNRVLRIGRVGLGVKDGDELSADIVGRWLIAQLKVNLRPIWSPAAGALGKLSERFEDLVWELLFQEVQNLEPGPWLGKVGRNMDTERENGVKEDSPWEEERSWRDPTAHKLHSAVSMWLNDGYAQTELLKAQHSKDRLDIHSYESQLLATLGICSPLAEKHNRVLVPHFLGLADPISKLPRTKLISWLTLFTKFTNPKALRSTNALHSLYTSLLSHPDRALQSLALTCLLTDNSSNLLPYKDLLRALLDETRFRDTLTSLDFQTIDPQARREVVNVIIRMLFGTMLERKGRGARGGSDRRTAVVGVLSGCTEEELALLVDLMLRPLGSHSATHQMETGTFTMESVDLSVAYKQRRGFLTLLGDVLRHLGPKLVRYWPALLGATVNLVGDAQKIVDAHSGPHEEAKEAEDESGEDVEDEDGMSLKVTRVIRQLGLKRLVDFFRSPVCFDFTPYMSACFASFISPRLASLDTENTQAPSALLELFYSWSADDGYIKFLVKYDDQVLPKIYDCLVAPSVKPVVIFRIFDIIDRLLVSSTIDENIRDTVFKPHVSLLLNNLAILVERSKGVTANESSLAQRQLNILSEIAQYSTDSTQASMLLDLFVPLLKRPSKFVSEKVKVDLLKIIRNLMQLIPDLSDESSSIFHTTYALLSRLFQSLRNRQARVSLVSTFQQFAMIDTSLEALSSTLSSLNAYSSKHMDEPDFDARLSAFVALNETQYKTLSCLDWLPLIYNMLHFIQDPAELAVRNNASFALRHFIDLVAAKSSSDFENTFIRILFPGLKNGLRSKSELVRAEVLAVIAYAVEKCDQLDSLQEMRVLLANGDEEANFFNNILHVQVHRRTRALRRLADHCNSGHLRSSNLAEIFVPLVGNYISSTASINHHLVNDAILTTGCMARKLGWGAYYALVQKYLKLSRAKDESERVYIRTLVSLLDNFHFPMEEIIPENEEPPVEDEESNRTNIDEVQGEATMPAAKASTMKQTTKIADAVNNKRIPIAIGIVTVAKHLPATTREPQITRLLTILSQILRSKSQETRDLTRDTLNRIVVSLGSSYLPLLLRELRAALLRGPQLHVLAYVVHSLLAYITAGDHAAAFEILDDCVNDISYVSAEVIFGESGKDVQSEDFKTRMREVRSSASKGLDSFAMTAKFITPSKISSLLAPLKAIMQETASLKVMNLVEEVLKRVAGGLNSNKHLIPQELLVLCNTLITQNARFLKQITTRRKKAVKDDAIVQIQRQEAIKIDHYAINSFRFVTFGLDLFNTALRRNRFDFHDNAVMSRLNAMIVAVGNTLYSNSSPVLLLGMRSAAGLSKCPLNSLNKSLPVFVRQILDIIQQTGSTDSEVVQVALKSLATILRDGPSVQVKEKDLVYLLELLAPDLEDPERQVSSFAMLRAIIVRKFVVPEIYDLMDKISEIMVTNQSPQVQELCRGALLQFLLDYPQGKGRLRKQMTFFTRNLSYVHESGRKSVLELLSAIITKFEVNLIHDYGDLLFVALVMLIANDDSAKCREMASVLIKNLLARLDNEHRKPIFSHLHTWALQQSQPQLLQVSSQVYGFVVDVLGADSLPHINTILEDLNAALSQSADRLAEAEGDDVVDLQWQVPYYALIVFVKVLRLFPDFSTQGGRLHWDLIVSHLLFPHAWVRAVSCRLLGILFMAVPPTLLRMREVAKNLCLQLKSEHLDEALSQQVVKNLFYIGKCFYAMALAKARDNNTLEEEQNDKNKEQEVRDTESFKQQNLLPWLFSTLSYQVKSAHIARRNRTSSSENWAQQPLAILRWFAAMATHMEPSYLEKFLVHILTPLYRLLEEDAINDSHMDELKTLATELQDLLQGKVGASQFSTTYNQIRQSVLGVRRDRKAARATQAVINPEAAARRRMHRNAVKKDSRKRKDRGFA